MSRRVTPIVASVVAIAVLGTACGDSRSRQRARTELVDQLVAGGLERPVADCVVEGFFVVRNDAELRDFFARDELTEAERAEFAELGEDCLDG
ncbi:MAG: hypothetical protein KDB40_15665 [Acidimicrobiales bacterium]|nr:hypothetical protein [Acidimicrobiales bacterium]MCB9393023.1 hypothetical protein [Acidimicrobiaceae bacterium]